MPVISLFFGIVIFINTRGEHNPPHIHAKYGEAEALFRISDGVMIAGRMPKRQKRMIEVWIDIHRADLNANWELAQSTGGCFKIDPLR